MGKLWHYTLNDELTNKNAGYSMWGFGEKEGKQYFIKQFLSPKYPAEDMESTPERLKRRRLQCERFEQKKIAIYETLNRNSDGNDVHILEFFRVKTRYYIVMEKVEALPWTIATIAQLPLEEKRRICMLVAHAIAALHQGGLIHADLKHENILYTQAPSGTVLAKVIDFDSSFLESDLPEADEEIVGDFNYFAPEVCARACGEEAELTCKMDVFSLGVLFHQYFCGALPKFDTELYSCPGETVLRGGALPLSEEIPEDISALLQEMLTADPAKRLTAEEVFRRLQMASEKDRPVEAPCCDTPQAPANTVSPFRPAPDLDGFSRQAPDSPLRFSPVRAKHGQIGLPQEPKAVYSPVGDDPAGGFSPQQSSWPEPENRGKTQINKWFAKKRVWIIASCAVVIAAVGAVGVFAVPTLLKNSIQTEETSVDGSAVSTDRNGSVTDSGTYGKNLTWTLENGVLTISGTGKWT